jgi:steroid 5-alpha reductase family enzyme
MTDAALLLATTFAVVAVSMLIMWLLSLGLRDASIVDVFWGLGFVLIAVTACAQGSGYPLRRFLVTALTTLWGTRLSLHLLWRNWGHGEDYRYRAMRERHGRKFAWVSLYSVFALQGVIMWIVSLPIQMAQAEPVPAQFTWFDALGTLCWLTGFCFEAIGDWQLARFKADPSTRGEVMDRGLWRYTRHPNYFGDALLWWGFFLIAAGVPGGGWTVIGPLVMTFFLMRVSGVTLLERKLVRTRPKYRDYTERTSAFFPWFPKSNRT